MGGFSRRAAGNRDVRSLAIGALGAVYALAVFVVDLASPLGVASGIPYVILVVLGRFLPWPPGAFVMAGIATALIAIGFFLSPPGDQQWLGVINRVLVTGVVWVVAILTFLHGRGWRRLQDSELRLRVVTDTAIDGIIAIDASGTIQMANPACEKLFGYSPSELLGRNVSMLMPSPDRERHDGYLRRYLETGEKRIIGIGREVTAQRKDGTQFPVQLAVGEAMIAGRRMFTGFLHDLSAERSAQQKAQDIQAELHQVSRIGEMGEMAAAIAHEVNQPLTAVGNYVEAARHELRRHAGRIPPSADQLLEKALQQAQRAGDVIRQVRALARRSGNAEQRSAEDIGDVIREVAALALIDAESKGMKVSFELEPGLPHCLINRTLIQQVLLNLMRNSIDAMQSSPRRELVVGAVAADGRELEVFVADTGPGLPLDVRERLFKPFVTTKPGGVGIGLSISYSIIGAHGGRLWTIPNDGGGTVFRFTIPVATEEELSDAV